MKYPELYLKSFKVFDFIFKSIFEECAHIIRHKDGATLLDIGCGPGNVTRYVLTSWLRENFSQIVAIDSSEEMIEYAREHYSHPKIQYIHLNIEGISNFKYDNFDHITSFNCLHWVNDMAQSFKNVHQLLKPGGDCILTIVVGGGVYNIIKKTSELSKWSIYFTEKDNILPIIYKSEDPKEEVKLYLRQAGFNEFEVNVTERTVNVSKMKYQAMLQSLDTFSHRIPDHSKQEYFTDQMEYARCALSIGKDEENNFTFSYKQLICCARKKFNG